MEPLLDAIWMLAKIVGSSILLVTLLCAAYILLFAVIYARRKQKRQAEAENTPILYTAKMMAVRKWLDELNTYDPARRPCHDLSPFEDVTLLEEIAWLKTLDCLLDYEYDYKSVREAIGQRITHLDARRMNLIDATIQP